ncbi:Crp/Fnr family transcriptional regulator [Granulicella sibirica]|uniref:Putative transcriptional regulator, Crp/Fnr family n=1 Tax=Granulicella sibirica TaxID=2479048 RepID=A0A4Q0SZ99_9BACT|nr:Crp/Fnr family transcriptional regulator [Granulicella sibirica]RXH55340.1 putative transcriptional regulator, Crp/Fnr family [Granulicella sibirica]
MTTDVAPTARSIRPRNLILSKLPDEQFQALSRFFVPVDLPINMQLSLPHQPIEFLYFPVSGLISTDALTEKGESVEVGLIGREGFAGLPALFGQPQMSHSVVIQGAGAGFRIRASIMREELIKGGVLAQLVHEFTYMQMVQMTQSVLCNRLHAVEARLARWLLTSADRTESEELQLTQEFLAQMLGSRRSTVTVAAGELQRLGAIDYSRGRIRLTDRPLLTSKTCECYGIVRSTYDRMLPKKF